MFKIEEVRDLAREAVAELDPACLDGRDAARLAEAAAEGAKLLDAATAMLAKRAADTNAWRRTSHAATADQWLAEVSGCTEGAARETFATAQRRVKRDRHLRTWTEGFATHGSFSGPTEDVAKILSALEPLTKNRFNEARTAGERESRDAYRFDALVTAVTTTGMGSTKPKKSDPTACVLVGLQPLLNGKTGPGEICEIPASARSRLPTPARSSVTGSCNWSSLTASTSRPWSAPRAMSQPH